MKKGFVISASIIGIILAAVFVIIVKISSHQTEKTISLSDNSQVLIDDIPILSDSLNLLRYADGKIVYSVIQENNGILEEKLYYVKESHNSFSSEDFITFNKEKEDILTFCEYKNKGIYALILESDDNKENIYLETISWDGTLKNIFCLNDFHRGEEDNCYQWKMEAASNGTVIIYSSFAYIVLDSSGTVIAEETLKEPAVYDLNYFYDDKVFLTQYDYGAREVSLISKDNETNLENLSLNTNNYQMLRETKDSILVRTDWQLYRYDPYKQDLKTIFSWSDFGIKGDKLWQIYRTQEGELGGLVFDNNKIQRVLWTDTAAAEKEQIVLGCLGEDGNAYWAAAQFNASQTEYLIKVKNYDSQNPAASVNLMYREILTGKGPDIIAVDPESMDYVYMGEKGILEDLTSYLADSSVIKGRDFVPSVYEAIQDQGKLYMLPTNFSISFMASKDAFTEQMNGWTISDILKMIAENPDLHIGIDKEQMLDLCFEYGMYRDIFHRGQAFDEKKFRDYLEFANSMPDEAYYITDEALYKNNKVLFEPFSVYEVKDYLYEKKLWGDGFTCMGFPGADGNGVVITPKYCWGINAQSRHKEAAWKFIENFFNSKVSDQYTPVWPFPIVEKLFQEQLKEGTEKWTYTATDGTITEVPRISYEYNGEIIEIYAASQDDVEEIKSLVNGAVVIYRNHTELRNIIQEEAAAFFAGQKSADDVSRIVGKRIITYMEENQ